MRGDARVRSLATRARARVARRRAERAARTHRVGHGARRVLVRGVGGCARHGAGSNTDDAGPVCSSGPDAVRPTGRRVRPTGASWLEQHLR